MLTPSLLHDLGFEHLTDEQRAAWGYIGDVWRHPTWNFAVGFNADDGDAVPHCDGATTTPAELLDAMIFWDRRRDS